MHSRRSRTLWLKLACELDADVLIPGAPHATSLYTSSKAEQACMWAWWANAWSSNCAYSVSEMRSMYTWQTSLRGGARCSKRARLAPTSSVNSSITAEGGSVLDALDGPDYQCNHKRGTHSERAGGRGADGNFVSADAASYPRQLIAILTRAFTVARTGGESVVAPPRPAEPPRAPSAAPSLPPSVPVVVESQPPQQHVPRHR